MKKRLFVSLLSCLWLTACGQKGPLYLPLDQAGQEQADQPVEAPSIREADAEFVGTLTALS